MATLNEMYERHDQEMKDLLEDQLVSWNALNEKYGKGNIPQDAYQQWDQQYGNVRLHGLQAQQHAELEAYPLNPLEYRYQQQAQQPETAPAPTDVFEQLLQKQQAVQTQTPIQQPTPGGEDPDDIFGRLTRKQQEIDRNGFDPGDGR